MVFNLYRKPGNLYGNTFTLNSNIYGNSYKFVRKLYNMYVFPNTGMYVVRWVVEEGDYLANLALIPGVVPA